MHPTPTDHQPANVVNRSFLTYAPACERLHIASVEHRLQATPRVELFFDSCDARRQVYRKVLVGADAAAFIEWSRTVGVDVRGSVMLAELPEIIERHLPVELREAASV